MNHSHSMCWHIKTFISRLTWVTSASFMIKVIRVGCDTSCDPFHSKDLTKLAILHNCKHHRALHTFSVFGERPLMTSDFRVGRGEGSNVTTKNLRLYDKNCRWVENWKIISRHLWTFPLAQFQKIHFKIVKSSRTQKNRL